jgi:hypothetical protein
MAAKKAAKKSKAKTTPSKSAKKAAPKAVKSKPVKAAPKPSKKQEKKPVPKVAAAAKAAPKSGLKPALKAAPPEPPKKVTQKIAPPPAPKRLSLPKEKPEPPPVDHAATIGPLYLGAGHGHLARSVDKPWIDAIDKYRSAVDEAVKYEATRSAASRAGMVLVFARQVQTMMNNLATRVAAIIAEVTSTASQEPQRESGKQAGKTLVTELKRLNDTYGAMVGPQGMAPFGSETLGIGIQPQLEQLQRAYFNNIARWADLERALG